MPTVECGFPGNSGSLQSQGPGLSVIIGRPARIAKSLAAMLDTGASINCIEINVAVALDLPVEDPQADMWSVSGLEKTIIYAAEITVPELHIDRQRCRFFARHDLRAIHPRQVLLGRPFLVAYKLIYDGRTGSASLSND